MKLVLTDSVSGNAMMVDTDLIRLVEPMAAGGSHIVFDSGMGRTVKEDYSEIANVLGAVALPVAVAALATTAKKKK